MDKYLVLGSAPYMSTWVDEHLNWFIGAGYRIICFNKSWKLVPAPMIYVWYHSDNFKTANTYVPTLSEIPSSKRINSSGNGKFNKLPVKKSNIPIPRDMYYECKCGTMFLNVIYSLLGSYGSEANVVVVGCDMIYTKNGNTFYSDRPESRAKNDPLRTWGETGLTKECEVSLEQYQKYGGTIRNASTCESRLPYPRFTDHLN